MYYTIKLCEFDKRELNKILNNHSQQLGYRLQHGATASRQELDCIGDDLKTIANIKFAIENAEEIPHGKE